MPNRLNRQSREPVTDALRHWYPLKFSEVGQTRSRYVLLSVVWKRAKFVVQQPESYAHIIHYNLLCPRSG